MTLAPTTNQTPAPRPAPAKQPNFWQKLGHGIARAFTIPADKRKELAANSIASIAKPLVESYAKDALYKTLRINLTPAEAQAAIGVLDPMIDASGVFK